jgi:hypothetical protein
MIAAVMSSQPAVSVGVRESHAPLGLRISIEHLWLGIPIFVLLWKCFLFPVPTLDFWWHLKLGDVIAGSRSLPQVDQFSFTATGKLFLMQNWLAELAYSGVYRLGGLPLIIFFNALLLVTAYVPIYLLCLKANASVRTAVVIAVLAVLGSICNVRPQVFSFAIFGLYYWVLERNRTERKDLLWTLPVLMLLWVNLHGAFVLGIGLVGFYVLAGAFRLFIASITVRDRAPLVTQLRKLAIVLILCILATLANPVGYRVYEYVHTVMTDAGSQQFVAEWQPPRIDEATGMLLFYGPFLLGVLVLIYSKSKPDFTEMALFLFFGAFGLKSLRNGVWFSMIAYPIVARYAPELDFREMLRWFRRAWVGEGDGTVEDSSDDRPSYYRFNLLFASIGICLLILQSPWVRPSLYKVSLVDRQTPLAAMDFINEHKLTGNIFHPQTFGDYLIWRLWPQQRSFIDGRVHLFGVDFVKSYQLVFHDSRWEDLLAPWNIRYLLLSKNPEDTDSLELIQSAKNSGHWTKLYEDDIAILLEKAAPQQ